jgi:FkbM family methyltransferase
MIKSVLIHLAGRLGYEIMASSKVSPTNLSHHLQVLFEKLDIDCVLDVGANIGQYGDLLRKAVGYNGLIISFEPVKATFELLKNKSESDDKWHVYDFALGPGDGKKMINVMAASPLSSFLQPDQSNTDLFASHNTIDHRETVEMRSVDTIIDDLRAKYQINRMFMKVDAQGYDLQVIRGAEKAMADVLAIQMELSAQAIYKETPPYFEVLREMRQRGYDLTGIFPITQDSLLRLIGFDCVLINRRVAEGADVRLLRVPPRISEPLPAE